MARFFSGAVGIALIFSLGTAAAPLVGSPPVANDVTIELQPGDFAAIAFDISDPDGDFVFVNFVGDPTYDGATDTAINTLCFCRIGPGGNPSCSCSSTVTAGQLSGVVTVPYTSQDSTGLVSNVATVTIIVGGGAVRTPARILEEIEFLIRQAVDGQNIQQGVAESLLAKVDAIRESFDRGNLNSASGQANALCNQIAAQSGKQPSVPT